MKILDIPQSGKRGLIVAFQSRFGLCWRQLVQPRNVRTPAREFMRGAFGHHSEVYSHKLNPEQLDRWTFAAAQVMSDPRLGQSGPLTGQQLYTSINSVRSRVNLPETLEVPARPTFSANPVGGLVITNTADGVRLWVRITGELTEDVMVFGQAPCSSGRYKRRNVAYLGLLRPAVDGLSEITDLYRARYGEPRPGTKIFIVTCQQKDGWKARDWETNGIVPDRPQGEQASAEGADGQYGYMHKGGTRDAQATAVRSGGYLPGSTEPATGGAEAAEAGLEGKAEPGGEGDAPV